MASSSGSRTASRARPAGSTCRRVQTGPIRDGLRIGTERVIGRIAQGRKHHARRCFACLVNVSPPAARRSADGDCPGCPAIPFISRIGGGGYGSGWGPLG